MKHKQREKKILVWGAMGIGNFVNFIPMLRELRRAYPNAQIDLICWQNSPHLALIDDDGYIDSVIRINKQSRLSLWTAAARLSISKYDAFIVRWHNNPWIARLIKCCWQSTIIGHTSSDRFTTKYDALVDIKVPLIDGISDKKQYLRLLETTGVTPECEAETLTLRKRDFIRPKNTLKKLVTLPNTNVIATHLDPAAAQPYKKLSATFWQNTLRKINEENPRTVFVILGSKKDEISSTVLKELSSNIKFIDCLGRFDLRETTAMISLCNSLIGIDSSLKTIASAVGTHSIIASGCTDFSRSAPEDSLIDTVRVPLPCSPCDVFGKTNWTSCPHHKCINDLTSDLFLQKFRQANCFKVGTNQVNTADK